MSRWTLLITAVVGVAVVAVLLNWEQPFPVEVTAVREGEIRTYIEERAKTRVPITYRITMPLNGRIQPITLQEGSPVKEGQLVAELDPDDLLTDVATSESQVGQYDQTVASIDALISASARQVEAAMAKWNWAKEEYDRQFELFEKKSTTESSLSEAELLKTESHIDYEGDVLNQRAMEAAKAAILIAKNEVQETLKQRQRDLNRAKIYSPVSGVVLNRLVTNKRYLPAGEVLLEIGRLDQLEVEVDVLSQDAVHIPENASVDISKGWGDGLVLGGTVSRIYPQGFTKVSSLGVEQQRVKVVVGFNEESVERLEQGGYTLRAGIRARVKIYTGGKQHAMVIPRSALFRAADAGWRVFTVRDRRAEQVAVKIGLANDYEVEIVEGLKAGDQVVIVPESTLESGLLVEPMVVDWAEQLKQSLSTAAPSEVD